MNRFTWRQFASGLLVATLSVGIAACDDDTTSGGGDMSGSMADMSATAGDMTGGGTPGNGQLTLADVVGTVYSPALPGGLAPRTHTLIGVASMPQFAGTPDPSSDFGVTPTIHGCSIYRYTATNLPGADGDAGDITFTGFNTAYTIGVNAANGSKSASPMAGSSPIKCTRSATTMQYGCAYSGMAGPDAGAAGALDRQRHLPGDSVQHRGQCEPGHDVGQDPAGAGRLAVRRGHVRSADRVQPKDPNAPGQGGANDCLPTNLATCTTLLELCEQSPIVPLGVSEIVETVAGGTDWPAAMATLGNGGGTDGGTAQLAGPLYISSVKSGTHRHHGHRSAHAGSEPRHRRRRDRRDEGSRDRVLVRRHRSHAGREVHRHAGSPRPAHHHEHQHEGAVLGPVDGDGQRDLQPAGRGR